MKLSNKNHSKVQNIKGFSFLIILFFASYLFIGTSIFPDYGISTDELTELKLADLTTDYILGRNTELLTYDDRHYGAVLQIVFKIIRGFFPDFRSDFLAMHYITFLIFFSSTIIFYKLLRKMGYNQIIALLGTTLLILHPHIFSHSFYNPKDIPFLSIFIICLYTLYLFIQKRTYKLAMLHGFFSGLLVVFRLPGILMWAITFLIGLWSFLIQNQLRRKTISLGLVYITLALATVYILLPAFWHDPIGEAKIFLSMDLFTWGNQELFMGQYLLASDLPWYHIPVYILVSTPPLYIFFFIIGNYFVFFDLLVKREILKLEGAHKLIAVVAFYMSMGVIILRDPVVYNGWRHVFFIYPLIILFIVEFFKKLWSIDLSFLNRQLLKGIRILSVLIIIYQITSVVIFISDSHPYEHVYYNRLAGKTLAVARLNYNMDYWSLSTREALENLLRIEDSNKIVVNYGGYGQIDANRRFLEAGSDRISIVSINEKANYFITDFRSSLAMEFPDRVMISNIKVRDAVVSATYKYIQ